MVAEVQRLGGLDSTDRRPEQSDTALYWAYQSSQRGFLHLAVTMLDAHPRPGGMAAHARIMSQLAVALADSAVLIWDEKERFGFWRPVTVIREGAPGVMQDRDWLPLVETPAHPEYPSGHASDCFTGANVLRGAFPELKGPVAYVAQVGRPPEGPDANSMGQHSQFADSGFACPAGVSRPDGDGAGVQRQPHLGRGTLPDGERGIGAGGGTDQRAGAGGGAGTVTANGVRRRWRG